MIAFCRRVQNLRGIEVELFDAIQRFRLVENVLNDLIVFWNGGSRANFIHLPDRKIKSLTKLCKRIESDYVCTNFQEISFLIISFIKALTQN